MDTNTLILLSIAVFFGCFIQTTIGFAAGLIAFPILLFKFDLQQATAIMSIFFLAFSIILVPQNWKDMDKKSLWKVGLISTVGLVLGVEVLKLGNLQLLQKLLGIMILIYVVYEVFNKYHKKIRWISRAGPLFGLVGGFTSGLFSHGGSIFIAYLNNHLKSARAVRATLIGILGMGNFFRIPTLFQTGIFNQQSLQLALYTSPAFLLGILLGHFFQKSLSDKLLKTLTLFFLSIAGVVLIFR